MGSVGNLILDELLVCAGSRHTSPVARVGVDWRDYGPIQDGLPVAHYRVRVERPDRTLSEESRTLDADEACRLIVQALTARQEPDS
jgi:hypothetical protein